MLVAGAVQAGKVGSSVGTWREGGGPELVGKDLGACRAQCAIWL